MPSKRNIPRKLQPTDFGEGMRVMKTTQPLAEQVRPKRLKDFIGQEQLVGKNQFLRQLIENGELVSLILWGPPGSGKTTLARIIAAHSKAEHFVEISAVAQGLADVKKVIEDARVHQCLGEKTLLFVDEIHRFNKAQQDAFLPHVESGLITLIGATTENPSFEVIRPLLSRCRVVVLEQLDDKAMTTIIKNAGKRLRLKLAPAGLKLLVASSAGDARIALNTLEVAALLGGEATAETIKAALHQTAISYDKTGEGHYNTISAYIKSLRGGDVNAALFYLGRMLESGEDAKFIARRMVIFASEDIGEAWNGGLTLALNVFQAVERIGLPEGAYALTHGTIVLAKAPKSRKVADSLGALKQAAHQYADAPVPAHVRNAPTQLMKDIGYGKDYEWQAGFEHPEGFLPKAAKDVRLYS